LLNAQLKVIGPPISSAVACTHNFFFYVYTKKPKVVTVRKQYLHMQIMKK